MLLSAGNVTGRLGGSTTENTEGDPTIVRSSIIRSVHPSLDIVTSESSFTPTNTPPKSISNGDGESTSSGGHIPMLPSSVSKFMGLPPGSRRAVTVAPESTHPIAAGRSPESDPTSNSTCAIAPVPAPIVPAAMSNSRTRTIPVDTGSRSLSERCWVRVVFSTPVGVTLSGS